MKINDTKRVHIEQLRIECDKDYAPHPHKDAHFSYPCLGCMEKGLAWKNQQQNSMDIFRFLLDGLSRGQASDSSCNVAMAEASPSETVAVQMIQEWAKDAEQ